MSAATSDEPAPPASELRALLGIALVAGVLAGLAQLLPPLRPLTHEFVQGLGLAGVVGLWLQARSEGRRGAGAVAGQVALVRTLAAGGVAWGVQLATSHLLWDCQTGEGSLYLWLTWLPMGLFAVAGGRASRRLGPWPHRALVVGLLLLDLGSVGLQALRGLRIVDPLLGLPQFVDQRADMGLVAVHAAQRLWFLGVALGIGAVDRWGWRRCAPALVAGGLLTGALGSHIGVGPGRAHLEQDLAEERREGRLVLRFPAHGWSPGYAGVLMERAQWAAAQLEQRWAMRVRYPVELRIFDDEEHMLASTGLRASHAGPFWIDLVLSRALDRTLEHELVHAQHGEWSLHPMLLIMRGVVEGSAEAWEQRLDRFPAAHASQAAALANGDLPSAAVFMRPGGFFRVNESNAYKAAASFVGWLILEHGIERWIDFQQDLDWERAYGLGLEQLDADWRAFLATVPVDLEDRTQAAERYDPALRPAYVDQSCPKVGRRTPTEEERAETLARLGDSDAALERYTALDRETPALRLLLQRLSILQTAGRHDEALALIEAEAGRAEAPHERDQLLAAKVHSLLHVDDLVALDRALADQISLRAQAGDPVEGLRRQRRLLADPETREETLLILRDQGRLQPGLARSMVAHHPGNTDVWDFFLEHGLRLRVSRKWVRRPAWLVAEHAEALELLAMAPLDCGRWGQSLVTLAEVAVDERDGALFAQVSGLLRAECGGEPMLMGTLDIAEERRRWLANR